MSLVFDISELSLPQASPGCKRRPCVIKQVYNRRPRRPWVLVDVPETSTGDLSPSRVSQVLVDVPGIESKKTSVWPSK